MHLLQEGGPLFMYTLLLLLFVNIALFIQGLIKIEKQEQNKELLSSIGLFALVFGFLGQIIGLIGAFDTIESIGNVSPNIISSGLKISFLTTGFGSLVFLVARFGIIVFTFMKKS
jgi:biopolymer transport protein ExbB/TolQ